MEPAFSAFREPHAWLIRGLVEYGWPDVTRAGQVPPGSFGGLSLSRFSSTGGRAGVLLQVPAVADGQWLSDDGVYEFAVQLSRDQAGQLAFTVRCPDANYLQQFTFDADNPLYAAGYIHQALTQYVPEFVRWRQGGGEVLWAQRAGLPTIDGEPCSSQLSQFVGGQVATGRGLDTGPTEGWWLDGSAPGGSAPVAMPAIASLGLAAENELRSGGLNNASQAMVEQSARGPGGALVFLGTLGVTQGALWLLNIALTLGLYGGGYLRRGALDYAFGLGFSLVFGLLLLAGGAVGMMGGRRYMQLKGGAMPVLAMVYAALVPGCCLLGLPVSLWAAYVWSRPEVRAIHGEG